MLAAREEPRGSLNRSYEIPTVRLRRRLWLLWIVIIGVCAVGAYRHAEFFLIYRQETTLMAIWAVLFLFAAVQSVLAWLERIAPQFDRLPNSNGSAQNRIWRFSVSLDRAQTL